MFKKCENPEIEELTLSFKGRYYRLSDLKSPIKDHCVWCLSLLKGRRQKWCSRECIHSALTWARPQKEHGLYNLLIRQNWKCTGCEYDYSPIVRGILRSSLRLIGRSYKKDRYFWLMKHLKNACEESRAPEVDHIEPIVFGGTSLGLSNVQVLCSSCHKIKTKADAKRRHDAFGSKLKGIKFTQAHCDALSKVRKGVSTPARKAARKNLFYYK